MSSSCQANKKTNYSYERHRPEETLIYQVVAKNLKSFIQKCEESGHHVPNFIKKEFECFLRCGVLSYGFARVYCQDCQYDRLVPFSCKKRGFCGSCLARRMSETSARLVDSLIPHIPTRQWVLSVPAPLRYLIAYDHNALNAVLSAFTGTLFSYLRKKAKVYGGRALEAHGYFPGAITFIQRFGSGLNLNVHLHSQISDGAYVQFGDDKIHFIRIPSPSVDEIRAITIKIAKRVHRYLERRMLHYEGDDLLDKEPLLAKCYAASIRYLSAFGHNAGKPLIRLISQELIKGESTDELTVMGFNLHASVALADHDRAGLERTIRYMGRPPLSADRLKMAPDGEHLLLTLKSPWRDGTSKIILTPFELLERLVALVPPPRKNLIRYHGVFGPNAEIRDQVVAGIADSGKQDTGRKIHRPGFAKLMARVFEIDVLECPRCKSKMQLISFITDPAAIKDILKSLKMSTAPPETTMPSEHSVVYESDGETFSTESL